MAPTKKSRSLNRRLSNYTEVSPEKDDGSLNKSKQRKRKLSDMLGSQWSKEELERFYGAFRKYGKDWKKVAGVVRNRSTEMVEALYNMNKAYLSLPEGTASVVGLIAMMTDHYSVLETSDSDRESTDASKLSRITQRRGQGKVQFNGSKEELLPSASIASKNDGCLSLLNGRRSDGRAVRKRTPRVPVAYSFRKDDNESCSSPNKSGLKSDSHDSVEHVAALALTEASQRGGSPQLFQSPLRTDHIKASSFQRRKMMLSQSEMVGAKLCGPKEDCLEGSFHFRGAENGEHARDSAIEDREGFGMTEVFKKGRKVYSSKSKVEDVRIKQVDDGWEECSGIEEGRCVDVNVNTKVTDPKMKHSSSLGKRKRKRKLFFGDGSSALGPLETLADASLLESESSLQLKEEKTSDLADMSSLHEARSKQREKTKCIGAQEELRHVCPGVAASASAKSIDGKDLTVNVDAISEGIQQPMLANKPLKKKSKSSFLKALTEEDEKSMVKGKRAGQKSSPSKQEDSSELAECISSSSDKKRLGNDSAVSSAAVQATGHANLLMKQRSRRKIQPVRTHNRNDQSSGDTLNYKHFTVQDGTFSLKDKLSCCLSSSLLRRWCTFEWFYSAIDYPWFAKREFVEYLNHVGLGHIPRLTRVEWGVIRSSLGKPRRFSEHFLCEEKQKLKQYRDSVRKHYAELHAGIREGLPTDLARPLSVGQRVIAFHPKTREVHDGSVLTVDDDKCRIQFDRPELGVVFVMDVDCMPLNSLENMPEALRKHNTEADKLSLNCGEPKAEQTNNLGPLVFAPNECLENVYSPIHTLMKQTKDANSQAKAAAVDIVNAPRAASSHPCAMVNIHAKKADVRALTELNCALDKKEAILKELKHANDEVLRNEKHRDSSLKESEHFKKQYAMVSSGLLNLRQRNTYPLNSLSPRQKPLVTSIGYVGPPSSIDHRLCNYQDLGSNVVEIVKESRLKASAMVDAAIQAMSLVLEGEDAFEKIGKALDLSDKQKFMPDRGPSVMKSPEQVTGAAFHQNQFSSTPEPFQRGHVSSTKSHSVPDRIESQIPSELITSCVATLLMVQMCTERQYPPADVAQILDSAVTSLHPCCPQNLPIYREIQMCMGRIKTQILALVPT